MSADNDRTLDSHEPATNEPQDTSAVPTQDASTSRQPERSAPETGELTNVEFTNATPKTEVPRSTANINLGTGSASQSRAHVEAATIDIPEQFTQTGYGTVSGDESPGTPIKKALPDRVGKYRLIRELGRGAFGVVYLGKDEDIDRLVAIKLSLVEDADYQRRLMVEASKVAKVAGKHIVQVLHVDRTDFGAVYIVQQYIEGCTLGTLIRNKTEISPGQAAILIYQLAIGLKSAHERDVLHRDLKPENILLQSDGTPYIVDFGIAISEDEQLGRNREIAGTPPFMSPEQIKGRVDFMDARSDIWALGVIFYELLTGKLPFMGRTSKELKEQICQRDPKPVHQYSPDTLSEDFDSVFRKCCAKKPSDRYATVDELAEAMLQLIQQHATIEDVDNPLGLGFQGKSTRGRVSRNPELVGLLTTGLETRNSLRGHTQNESMQATVNSMSATVADHRSSYALQIATAVAAAIIVAVVFLVADVMRSDPNDSETGTGETEIAQSMESVDPSMGSPDQVESIVDAPTDSDSAEPDPTLLEYDPEADRARIVAATGLAHHRSIQAAIDASSGETPEVISIAPGFYRESIKIKKPVRLVAADPENRPNLVAGGEPLFHVDCDGGLAQLENLVLTGNAFFTSSDGAEQPSQFNLIDVVRGSLQMTGCQVQKSAYGPADTFNSVKVHRGAELLASQCEFTRSPGFAISGNGHANIAVDDCRFQNNGVQMHDGSGVIEGCIFSGDFGVQVQQSGDEAVKVTDCEFQSNSLYAINATEGGQVDCRSNRYTLCATAIRATAQNQAKAMAGESGSIRAQDETFDQCRVAVSVHSGKVIFDDKCSISGSEIGVMVEGGTFAAKNLLISDCSTSGLFALKEAEQVGLDSVRIEKCENYGIEIENCKKTYLRNVTVNQCKDHGVYIGAGTASIDGLTIDGSGQSGLVLTGTPTIEKIQAVEISNCKFGIFCEPDEFHELYLEIKNGRLADCSEVCIYARMRTEVALSGVTFEGVAEGRKKFLPVAPAKIRVIE